MRCGPRRCMVSLLALLVLGFVFASSAHLHLPPLPLAASPELVSGDCHAPEPEAVLGAAHICLSSSVAKASSGLAQAGARMPAALRRAAHHTRVPGPVSGVAIYRVGPERAPPAS